MTKEEVEKRKIDNEAKRIDETKQLVELFLATNASDIELSKQTGISSSTIGRRLTDKSKILKAFPENGEKVYTQIKEKRQQNLQAGKVLGGQTSMVNNIYLNGNIGKFEGCHKLRLDVITANELQQWELLMHLALTFRLKLTTLAELFQIEEQQLLGKILTYNKKAYNSLLYLFYRDETDQEIAKEKFIHYYRELLKAIKVKNEAELTELLAQANDVKITEFASKRTPFTPLSDNEVGLLIDYQLKYGLTSLAIARKFGIDVTNYQKVTYNYLSDKPYLKERFDALLDYYDKVYQPSEKRG